MDEKKKEKWYFRPSSLIVSFLLVGPFMLPLVWFNPGFSKKAKMVISAVVIGLSIMLTMALVNSVRSITSYYRVILDEKI